MSRELLKLVIAECSDEGIRSNITTKLYGAITEYLEMPEPEPVAWVWQSDNYATRFSQRIFELFEEADDMRNRHGGNLYPLYFEASPNAKRIAELEALNADLLRQLSNYHVGWESQEDLLEQLYWEFDADRKKQPENERIRFKGKLRFFADQVNQSKQPIT